MMLPTDLAAGSERGSVLSQALAQLTAADDRLRASEQRYRALAELSPEGILVDIDGRYVYANPAAARLFGADSPAALLGLRLRGAAQPLLDRLLLSCAARAAHGLITPPAQMTLTTLSGRPLAVEVSTGPVIWDGKAALQILLRDVTKCNAAQDALDEKQEQLDAALDISRIGIWRFDLAGDHASFDGTAAAIYGVASDRTLTTEQFLALIHPDDRAAFASGIARLRRHGEPFDVEHRVPAAGNGQRWVHSRGGFSGIGHPHAHFFTGASVDVTDRKLTEETLWQRANFDTLTGLPNRRLFRDRLDQEIKKAHRNAQTLALLFIDLDRFKEVNDLLGHAVGDRLLIEAAQRIHACVRQSDTVARLGGDEFTAILTDLDALSHVDNTAQKIIDALTMPFHLDAEEIYLSASVGITLFESDADNAEDLIRNADQAMYAAKNAGRNQYSYFTPRMQQEAHNRLRLIGDLRSALHSGQLEVHFQPVVALDSGAVTKAEALLRWRHPRHGLIEPTVFIPYAEESGLINEIGDWVFQQAARCSLRWSRQLGRPFQIGVNRSPVQFRSRQTQLSWAGYLERLGLPGSSIAVEITEGVLLHASNSVTDNLMQFRDAGIEVAIDDFGTGYSSMAYLKKFHIDYLKIDQSFIHDMAVNTADRAIVKAMIVMAHELDLRVVAEGIETQEQQRLLVDAGCDFGQGFLFSKAIPAREFESRLTQQQ